MQIHRSVAVARHDLTILKRDPLPPVLLIFMPLLLMSLTKPVFGPVLVSEGTSSANGAEQAVPGMAVMFSFFLVGTVGFAFFREHGWNTWDRLRVTRASTFEIVIGKALGPTLVSFTQFAVLFLVGVLVLDLHITGSVLALALVLVSLTFCLVSLGVALVAFLGTVMQLNAISSLMALTLGGLGGALVPVNLLPGWAQAIAPVTPSYWAMRGLRSVILYGAGVGGVLPAVGMLTLFTGTFVALSLIRFRVTETKTSWA